MFRPFCCALVILVGTGACNQNVPSPKRTTISVLAASSLTEAFTEIGRRFEAAHKDVRVRFEFAASSTLARQINDGNAADVFAAADQEAMDAVETSRIDGRIIGFALNTLEVAVPPANRAAVRSLHDLSRGDITVALCRSNVPCGRLAEAILRRARVRVPRASREDNVKAVVTKVALDEADAGVVYRSDVVAARGKIRGIPIPKEQNTIATYSIAVLKSAHVRFARAFEDFVLSGTARRTLARYGFTAQ